MLNRASFLGLERPCRAEGSDLELRLEAGIRGVRLWEARARGYLNLELFVASVVKWPNAAAVF